MRFKRRRRYYLAALLIWLALLLILWLAERNAEGGNIHTLGDALWYFVITVSTVGYGDLYPHTLIGRITAFPFVLMSVGLLAFLISSVLLLFRSRIFPEIVLRTTMDRHWYVFPKWNSHAEALAEKLTGVIVSGTETAADPYFSLELPVQKIVSRRKPGDCTIVIMGDDSYQCYREALELSRTGCRIVCESSYAADAASDNLTLFDAADCGARLYWNENPIQKDGEQILLIGDGKNARALLSRAVMTNVYGPLARVTYHLFGDWDGFLELHQGLSAVMDLRRDPADSDPAPLRDALILHSGPWQAGRSLLAGADRIIVCGDLESENAETAGQLLAWFPVAGRVDCLCGTALPGVHAFMQRKDLYTPENVMQERLSRTAILMNDIYRASTGGTAPDWSALTPFLKQSNIASADHLSVKIRILLAGEAVPGALSLTPALCRRAMEAYRERKERDADLFRQIEHERWLRFYSMYNWAYGPKKDNQRRLHPDYRPYQALTPSEQEKDDYSWELIGAIAEHLEKAP